MSCNVRLMSVCRLIEAAENGDEEAAQAAIQEKEGLDVNLPGPDGVSVCAVLHKRCTVASTSFPASKSATALNCLAHFTTILMHFNAQDTALHMASLMGSLSIVQVSGQTAFLAFGSAISRQLCLVKLMLSP